MRTTSIQQLYDGWHPHNYLKTLEDTFSKYSLHQPIKSCHWDFNTFAIVQEYKKENSLLFRKLWKNPFFRTTYKDSYRAYRPYM